LGEYGALQGRDTGAGCFGAVADPSRGWGRVQAGPVRIWHLRRRLVQQRQRRFCPQRTAERPRGESRGGFWSGLALRHEFAGDWTLRLGRTQTVSFLASEYRLAGFAMPWARVPTEVYGLVPLSNLDTLALQRRWASNSGLWLLRAGLPWLDIEVPRTNDQGIDSVQARPGHYLTGEWWQGPWRLKLEWTRLEVDYDSPNLSAALAALETAGSPVYDPAAAAALRIKDARLDLFSFGAAYDSADWLLMLEYAERHSESALGASSGAYLTVGRRLGDWMPYLTVAKRDSEGATVQGSNPLAQALVIDAIYAGQDYSRWSYGLGLSYALSAQLVFKAQLDVFDSRPGSYGPSLNHTADYPLADPPAEQLFSLSLDFVF